MQSAEQRRLLIVEDDPGLQSQMRWCLDDDVSVATASDAKEAIAEFRRHEPQVVTLDLGLPPEPGGATVGFELLHAILELDPGTKVIVITGREETEHAVTAIGVGAYDFYQKPVDGKTLAFVVDRAFRLSMLEAENERLVRGKLGTHPLDGVVASSDAMIKACNMTDRVARADVSVLVTGETGTGKELIARAVHALSERAKGPFVAINCAAIPENLLESELFGFEKGAFTGATSQKKGKVETADGGTLFLDEIGDMPLALQAKMLRFLQERSVERIGGHSSHPVDVRLVSATHRDLRTMIAEQTFREDLFYRIGEVAIHIPPLRERPGDAVLIARSLLARQAGNNVRPPRLSSSAVSAIEQYSWPGNVRELENKIRRGTILADSNTIVPEDLELDDPADSAESDLNLRIVRERAECEVIRRTLARTDCNIAEAARLLGVTRPTLYGLLDRYGIERTKD